MAKQKIAVGDSLIFYGNVAEVVELVTKKKQRLVVATHVGGKPPATVTIRVRADYLRYADELGAWVSPGRVLSGEHRASYRKAHGLAPGAPVAWSKLDEVALLMEYDPTM